MGYGSEEDIRIQQEKYDEEEMKRSEDPDYGNADDDIEIHQE